MRVIVRPIAAKYFERLDANDKDRFRSAFTKLSKEPLEGDIIPMIGQSGYFRLRVGGYRALYYIENDTIFVTNIDPRGQVYKKKNRRKK
jgi:mRNA-degrading endonuclease RelE of RelBE toxin-antitoxin system